MMFQIWNTGGARRLIFHPKALEEIRDFPQPLRIACGELLRLLQEGVTLGMPASRPMPAVATGIEELRIRGLPGQFRVFYLKKSRAGILILRAFHKKTQETPHSEIVLVGRRLKELTDETE